MIGKGIQKMKKVKQALKTSSIIFLTMLLAVLILPLTVRAYEATGTLGEGADAPQWTIHYEIGEESRLIGGLPPLRVVEIGGGEVDLTDNLITDADFRNTTFREGIEPIIPEFANVDVIRFTAPITVVDGVFSGLFAHSSVQRIERLDFLVVSDPTNMVAMFYETPNLREIDISGWDVTDSLEQMAGIFRASGLEELDLNNWNVSNVGSMFSVFREMPELTYLNISCWNLSSADTTSNMFSGTTNLESVDVSNWDVSNVTTMNNMFANMRSLKTLDVSSWNVSSVVSMHQMFLGASSLENLNVSDWDTSSATDMSGMFRNLTVLESIDVSNWDVSNVTLMNNMFQNAPRLRVLDLGRWEADANPTTTNMFNGATSLQELHLSVDFTFVNNPGLPPVPEDGRWHDSQGLHSLTSAQLWRHHNDNPATETWTWDSIPPYCPEPVLSPIDIEILAALQQPINFSGTEGSISEQFVGQVRNELMYLELTRVQADQIIANINAVIAMIEAGPYTSFETLAIPTAMEVIRLVNESANIAELTVRVDIDANRLPVVTVLDGRLIRCIRIDEFDGDIDHAARTIMFEIPEDLLTDGRFQGVITGLPSDMVYFSGVEHRLGDSVDIGAGDYVRVAAGIQYRIIFEPIRDVLIHSLVIDRFDGDIDHDAKTITFSIPPHLLNDDGSFNGVLTDFEADAEELIFFVGGQAWNVGLGGPVGFSSGDSVSVAGGIDYTVIIEEETPCLERQITELVIDRFEGEIDQYERTITFSIPSHLLNDGSFNGVLTSFATYPASDELIFFVGGQEWNVGLGGPVGLETGDRVSVAGGIDYTVIIEEETPCLERQITELVIDRFEGEIDQDERTITFSIPSHLLNNGRLDGILTSFATYPAIDELIFFVGGQEWNVGLGSPVGLENGDRVSVAGGVDYTVIIEVEEPDLGRQITELVIDRFEGEIDQDERTITFRVLSHLLNDGRFNGVLTDFEAGDAEELIFFAGGSEWPLGVGSAVGLVSGDRVSVAGGVDYTLVIEPVVVVEGEITQLTIGDFEGEIDQDERTITFSIPSHLVTDGRFSGVLTSFATDLASDELVFFAGGSEWVLREGNTAGFITGDLVYLEGGIVYTLIIAID